YRWNGRAWQKYPGGIVKVDVDALGRPWGVNRAGMIYVMDVRTKKWKNLPGRAKDIGCGGPGNGVTCIIGTNKHTYKWDGRKWLDFGGAAKRVDVDKHGNPWVVNDAGVIYRYEVKAKKWVHIPTGRAIDIACGPDGTIWVLGTDKTVYKWNGKTWLKGNGMGYHITVDNQGLPWVIGMDKGTWTRSAITPGRPVARPPVRPGIKGAPVSVTTFAECCSMAYHLGKKTFRAPAGFRVLLSRKDRSGVQGVTFVNGNNTQMIVSFAGTQAKSDPKDVLADVGIVKGEADRVAKKVAGVMVNVVTFGKVKIKWPQPKLTPTLRRQVAAAERFVVDSQNKLRGKRYNLTVTGHSLGGYLAEFISAKRGLTAHTFNGPGVTGHIAPNKQARLYAHIRNHDIVGRTGKHLGATIVYENTPFKLKKIKERWAVRNHSVDEFHKNLRSGMKPGVKTAGQKIGAGMKKVGTGIKKGAEKVGNGIKKGAEKVGKGIKKGFKKLFSDHRLKKDIILVH
ncbi:tectonin domain-containing protein, partial [Candidatus Riflebacteria bacterium]